MSDKNLIDTQKQITIGVLFASLSDNYQNTIWAGIKYQSELLNIRLLCFYGSAIIDDIYTSENRIKNRNRNKNLLYELVDQNNIDILLVMTGPLSVFCGVERLKIFLEKIPEIPLVSIGVNIPGLPCVVIDNEKGMFSLVTHFIEDHGCKKIAFIKGPDFNEEAEYRFKAYQKSLQKHNIPYDPQLVCSGHFMPGDGYKGVKKLLDERKVNFDAIIGVDDYTAIEIIDLLLTRGFQIPGEIKVGGFDDIERSRYSIPLLTTVRQPLFELGMAAVVKAHETINRIQSPLLKKIDIQLIKRESCGCTVEALFTSDSTSSSPLHYNEDFYQDIIENIDAEIIKQYKISCFNKSVKESLTEKIKHLTKTIIISIKKESEQEIKQVVEKILLETIDQDLNASFWSSIVSSIFTKLKMEFKSFTNQYFLKSLWNLAILTLVQTEARHQMYARLDDLELWARLNKFGDDLITSYTIDNLKYIFDVHLPVLRINQFFFSLYMPNRQQARILYYLDKKRQPDKEDKIFPSRQFTYGNEIIDSNDSYFILPVDIKEKPFGFIAVKITNISLEVYKFIIEKIARALKGIELMEKLNNHATDLQHEVEKRTEELQKANELLKEQAYKDQLTGLSNRRFLMDIIYKDVQQFLKRTIKAKNTIIKDLFVILMIDIDHFKMINDKHGHVSGDKILKQISLLFRDTVFTNDFILRMGGEEFLIILRNFDHDFLEKKIEKIRKAVEEYPFEIESGETIPVTCSIGSLTFPVNKKYPAAIDFLSAISLADKGLYYAKQRGRNRAILLNVADKCFTDDDVINRLINNFDECLTDQSIELFESP